MTKTPKKTEKPVPKPPRPKEDAAYWEEVVEAMKNKTTPPRRPRGEGK